MVGKGKQNNMPKLSENVNSVKMEEIRFLDMSSLKQKKGAPINAKRH